MPATVQKTAELALRQIVNALNADPFPCHWKIREAIDAGRLTLDEIESRRQRLLENRESDDDPDKIGY